MIRSSLFWRLYAGYALLVLLSTAIIGFLVGHRIQRDTLAEIENSLLSKARLLVDSCSPEMRDSPGPGFNDRIVRLGHSTETRITIIAADGTVLADSDESPGVMENHGTRPEVLDARERGVGTATRHSATLDKEMVYLAIPVREGRRLLGFVRTSLPLTLVDERLAHVRRVVVLGAVSALAVAFVVGYFFTRRVTKPLASMASVARRIASGEHEQRIRLETRDEMAELAESFNAMADELKLRIETITVDRSKLLAVLGGMIEGVVAVDSEERVLHMNAAAGRILEARPQESLGRPLLEICRIPEVSEALVETMRRVREIREEVRVPASVRDRTIELHASPLHDSAGGVAGAVVILHDMTEIRRLEQVRRDFVANVSHELKTPLTAIRGLIETILEDREMDGETRRGFLERIGGQATRLSTLVKDLLALSRIESREGEFERRHFDLRGPVEESFAALSPEGRAKGLEMGLSVPDAPVIVGGDDEALREVVDNLVNNAVRYTRTGGSVKVRLGVGEKFAVLEVEDTGIGIEPRDQERIFERFYRVEASRSSEVGGTGLGLAIVKHIAIAHGGDVSVESAPGVGSTFRVRFPLAPSSA